MTNKTPNIDDILDRAFAVIANPNLKLATEQAWVSELKAALLKLLEAEAMELNNGELDKAYWAGWAVPITRIREVLK